MAKQASQAGEEAREPQFEARRLLTASGVTYEDADAACVRRHLGDEFFWLDVCYSDPAAVEWLGDHFELHPLVREDLRNFGQRPKLEPYGNYSVLVVYGASPDDDGLVEVHCILAEHYLITVRRDEAPSFDALWERYAGDEPFGPGALLLYRVVDVLIDSFFPSLAELDERIDELEGDILANPATTHLRALMAMKRWLISLRKVIAPQRDLFAQVVAGNQPLPGWSEESMRYFRDAYDHLIRLADIVDTYRDLLTSTLDVYLSARADQRDDVMKQLTLIATVFLPITFVTGFFGQNFGFMVAHISSREAFVVGSAIQLAIVGGILLVFRRRGWL